MKIKLLKDIPRYKSGEIVELGKIGGVFTENSASGLYTATWNDLLKGGFAEEINDIDIEEIRKEKGTIFKSGICNQQNPVLLNFSKAETEWFSAYRIVKAVIEKLNGGWEFDKSKGKELMYDHDRFSFDCIQRLNTQISFLPVCKDEKTAEKVISLCETELKVLFAVTA